MGKYKANKSKPICFDIKHLTDDEFQLLGEYDVAYIKPIHSKKNLGFSIHSADGAPMGFSDSKDLAILAVKENNLTPVSVH